MGLQLPPGRSAVVLLATALAMVAALPSTAAQPAGSVRRIGYLSTGSPNAGFHQQFVQGLAELGWVVGKNIEIEFRFADSRFERLPGLAADLARRDIDLIVAQPTAAAVAAKNVTRTIPIVMINAAEPVGLGLVKSLSRPGGNVTGTAWAVGLETIDKGLELLKEVVPGVRRVAVLSNPDNPAQPAAVSNLKRAAKPLGLQLVPFEARGSDDFGAVFAKIAKERPDALYVLPESLFVIHRTTLAELAVKQRLPTIHGVKENVEAGGLASYGPSLAHASRRGAAFADKILKGAKPAELPVEQPTKFELVINVKTAKALGLTLSPALLLRADEVVE